MNIDLKIIKKKYGEKMSRLCRELFPIILETEGLLSKLLLDNFDANHFLYEDIVSNNLIDDFKNFIYELFENDKFETTTDKSPIELLEEVGYDLYECKTEKEIQSFKKYYAHNEELCTFNGGRLDRCRVFFAVKKDVDNIKREDFSNPERQDEYGTSVINIQFTNDLSHTLSIKNRYNHMVKNPDATFGNNLDNIVPGLTNAFEMEYGLVQRNGNNILDIPNYIRANDGKYYKYNYEINNIYYCSNNIIVDNFEVKPFDKSQYIVLDYFILDLKTMKISLYDQRINDSFVDSINENDIEKIEVINMGENKEINIIIKDKEPIVITLDSENNIISLNNNIVEDIGDYFLRKNKCLHDINLPSVKKLGIFFLYSNETIEAISLPKVEIIGDAFLAFNECLIEVNLPVVKSIGSNFLFFNEKIETILLPKVEHIGEGFLHKHPKFSTLYENKRGRSI